MPDKKSADESQINSAIRAFESQALYYADKFIADAKIRSEYISKAQELSRSTRALYDSGKITALQAEEIANLMRNEVMELARARTSNIGKSVAILLKEKGIPLEELVVKYAAQKFGKLPQQLTAAERNGVALAIVSAAGRTDAAVNTTMRGLGKAGRGFWVLTALVAAYNVGTAENKAVAAGREGANIAGGFLGEAGRRRSGWGRSLRAVRSARSRTRGHHRRNSGSGPGGRCLCRTCGADEYHGRKYRAAICPIVEP